MYADLLTGNMAKNRIRYNIQFMSAIRRYITDFILTSHGNNINIIFKYGNNINHFQIL